MIPPANMIIEYITIFELPMQSYAATASKYGILKP